MKTPIVWIIDDDMISCFASNYKFDQYPESFEVTSHSSAYGALTSLMECLQGNQKFPDIILLDLRMPGMDGWSFLSKLEKMDVSIKEIHVYILSAFTNSRDSNLAKKNLIIKGFFNKPLSAVNVEQIFNQFVIENISETLN